MPEEPSNVHATSALPDDIRESVSVNNVKTLGESTAFWTSMQMSNAVAHQGRLNAISEAATAAAVKNLIEVDAAEGSALIPLVQQLMKGAQTTPPPTA